MKKDTLTEMKKEKKKRKKNKRKKFVNFSFCRN